MPNVLEAAGKRLLRVFSSSRTGYGLNRVCFTHVDNCTHTYTDMYTRVADVLPQTVMGLSSQRRRFTAEVLRWGSSML